MQGGTDAAHDDSQDGRLARSGPWLRNSRAGQRVRLVDERSHGQVAFGQCLALARLPFAPTFQVRASPADGAPGKSDLREIRFSAISRCITLHESASER